MSTSSSFPRTIVSYTVTTSLFVVIFLCSVFFFTRRSLEPSLSPYYAADIPLSAVDLPPPTPLLPQIEPHDGDVTVETKQKEVGDSRRGGDDVAVETELKLKDVEESRTEKTEVEEEGGEGSRGESVDHAVAEKMRGCDLYKGSWVKDDDEYPLYQPGSCPYVDEAFDCQRNGRRDSDYLNWRWKPDGCDLPRYDALFKFSLFSPPLLLYLI